MRSDKHGKRRTYMLLLLHGAFMLAVSSIASAETITITPDRDGTLIEHPTGALANGAGPSIFVGRTGQSAGSLRRALLHFDVAGAMPDKAIVIESVTLVLDVAQAGRRGTTVSIHRLLDSWGEGTSRTNGGSGAPAAPGDATWVHRSFPDTFWKTEGGRFQPSASGLLDIPGTGEQTASTRRMINDVRRWLHAPNQNFGWILIGDEGVDSTARKIHSRESVFANRRPALEITYRVAGGE